MQQKKSLVQALVIGALLLLTLPIFYLLMARVFLPMGWGEEQDLQDNSEVAQPAERPLS